MNEQPPANQEQTSAPPDGPPAPDERFPIVGVGASAGGLEALESLFSHMPLETGMAFVVIQHLSPDFRSMMDELLARQTSIPIIRVEDGIAVQPNAIYLIPPRKEMILSAGRLLLSDKTPHSGLTLPIDIFFRSLAQDAGPRAVGVILSGTGSDGSRGVCDIHAAGGLVLVQTVETSGFDGMPKSAIETGVVDAVLAPAAMPDALRSFAAGEPVYQLLEEQGKLTGTDAIFELLRRDYGIDFSHYKSSTVARRVQRRLSMHQITDLDVYVERLRNDPAELNSLYKDLLIGVTKFFRDANAFTRLQHVLLEMLAAEPPELRVWVAGCATGEEAYSLAILLHEQQEHMRRRASVKIFATDVHPASLEIAGAGQYSEASLSEVSPDRLARYFRRTTTGYQVTADLRQMVVFAPHNIIKDAPFTKLDLITCRNLLIYLEPAAQRKAISLFHFGLNTKGVMMLGPSESPGDLSEEFESLDDHWKIYRKRRDKRLSVEMRLPLSLGPTRLAPPSLSANAYSAQPDASLLRAYDALLSEHAPPSLLINERRELVQSFGGASRRLAVRDGRMSTDVLDMIDPALRTPLSTALQQAASRQTAVGLTGVATPGPQGEQLIKLTARPLGPQQTGPRYLLVTFEELDAPQPRVDAAAHDAVQASQDHVRALEEELGYARENLQATVEELAASNEELQAANEELVTSNEELQSTNEELHSVNEELYSVNAEYQRKIAELTELTADMDNLLQSTDVGVMFLDGNLNVRRFTPRMARTFHLLPQDIGRRIDSFAHTIDRPKLLEEVSQVLATGEPIESEVVDRSGVIYFLRILPYRTKRRVAGVVLTLIDISPIKRVEASLRLMSKVFQDSADPIMVEDLNGNILDLNGEAARTYGWTREELIGQHFELLAPASERARARELRQMCSQQGGVRNQETVKVGKDGQPRPFLLTLSLLCDEHNTPVAIASVAKEITALKKAESRAQDAVRRRDQLLAMLSHELRNPLGAVLNATYLFDRNPEVPEMLSEAAGIIQRQSLQMARLLDDLLDISRVTQGKIEIRKKTVDLVTLVDEALQAVQPLLDARSHKLTRDVEVGPLWVDGDAARLQQIQQNLLTNAAKYTSPGGEIKLTLRRDQNMAVFTVRDSGRGIPAELLERIFDLFVQGEDTLDRADGGMGVGLTLVRTLVHLHGGDVQAFSEGLNHGSEFRVRIPLTTRVQTTANLPQTPTAAPHGSEPSENGRNGQRRRIVIVEDNADSRTTLEAFLRLEGYVVSVAEDGLEGVEKILAETPETALIDIGLPGLDGYQVCRTIRAQQKRPIRLIALTGYGRVEDRQAVTAAGFDAHLVKPLKPDELAQLLGPPAGQERAGRARTAPP